MGAPSEPTDTAPDPKRVGSFERVGDEFIAQADATYSLLQLAYELPDRELDLSTAEEGLSAGQQKQVWDALQKLFRQVTEKLESGQPVDSSFQLGPDPTVGRAIWRMVINAAHQIKMPSRNLLVRRSMLLLAVSDFELLMGQVAQLILNCVPGLASAGDASITLSELENLKDVAAARQVVIDRKVDDLLRGSLEDWVGWFDRVNVSWKDMADDWCDFAEIFARRNVVVHAGGKVTPQYLGALRAAKCARSALPTVGTQLDLDDEYLAAVSEQVLAFGFLLVAGSWLQLTKADTAKAEMWIDSRCQLLLELHHFRAVNTICRTVLKRSRGRLLAKTELSLQTMSWVARREMGDGDAVRAEVASWETSGTDLRYAHAKAVLLDDDDKAVEQIAELRRRNHLTAVELVASPLYRGLIDRRRGDLLPEGPGIVSLEIAQSEVAKRGQCSEAVEEAVGGDDDVASPDSSEDED